jgi:hypothetical protein
MYLYGIKLAEWSMHGPRILLPRCSMKHPRCRGWRDSKYGVAG